ncbi:DUF5682 family protein [Streptomyces sp. NPDC093099]|uniref:DUF5682 family protein n=1 Tax=Streptomyces sp. NPDC093099 TaxID=3366028 RepID=UPI003812A1AF
MPATFLGVRHHSPVCARLVARTIATLRPSHVLIEGPADMNDRLDELLLGHELPVAVFSHYRDAVRTTTSWTPFCAYSPEWVALTEGRAAGARVRFIDLPAWHPAFEGRSNRYADAEARYVRASARLRDRFGVDCADALWDRLFEAADPPDPGGSPDPQDPPDPDGEDALAERLALYFDVLRGDAEADTGDRAREEYMAGWVRASLAEAGERPVLVVTGGFHRPALRALVERPAGGTSGRQGGPEVPRPPADAEAGSHLVPYSFHRLDAFTGYQSGMPSPGYHQDLWENGPRAAGDALVRAVTGRLRARGVHVSTAALIGARAAAGALAALRGHTRPARLDLFDGLAGALLDEAVDEPLPWTRHGRLRSGTHPVLAELVAAGRGDRTGRLHPDTPLPPLVRDVTDRLAALGLDFSGPVTLWLTETAGRERSRLLHRLRILAVPGYTRTRGPGHGTDPEYTERWEPGPAVGREAALIEAGSHGRTLEDASAAALAERIRADGSAPDALAGVLFDTVVCGVTGLLGPLLAELRAAVGRSADPGPLGEALHTALGLWRHDRVYGVGRDPLLAGFVDAAAHRVLWLVEGVRGAADADLGRLRALAAVRDALLHAADRLTLDQDAAVAVCTRVSGDREAPADLRGAAFGLCRSLGTGADPAAAVASLSGPAVLGDWLAGLFALAREELTTPGDDSRSLLATLDTLVTGLSGTEFLVGLPALRQAFAYFPPRERRRIADRLLERRGLRGSARSLLRTTGDPLLLAHARQLEDDVLRTLDRHGLGAAR